MKRYFIKRSIQGRTEYYGRESDWTTDMNEADGYLTRVAAASVIDSDIYLHGAYISAEDVHEAKCTSIEPSGTLQSRADIAIAELHRVLAEFQAVTAELQQEIKKGGDK